MHAAPLEFLNFIAKWMTATKVMSGGHRSKSALRNGKVRSCPRSTAYYYASPLNLDIAASTLSDAQQSPDITEFYTLNYADPDKLERETMSYFPR